MILWRRIQVLFAAILIVCVFSIFISGFDFMSSVSQYLPNQKIEAGISVFHGAGNIRTSLNRSGEAREWVGWMKELPVQVQRRLVVRKSCEVMRRTGIKQQISYLSKHRWKLENFFVDDNAKVIYCSIPKTGSTHWKRMMAASTRIHAELAGKLRPRAKEKQTVAANGNSDIQPYGINPLSNYNSTSIERMLKTYYKFMIVRNPYARLLSIFRNKTRRGNTQDREIFQRKHGVEILRRYRQNGTKLVNGTEIKFPEFLKYVSDEMNSGKKVDPNWDTYEHLCHVCAIDYNFIGKIDSDPQNSEMNELLHILGIDSIMKKFPERSSHNTSADFLRVYNKLPHSLLQKVQKTYEIDFLAFGYDKNNVFAQI